MKHTAQPIIVVRRKVHGHGHHGGAWKVAYADFVTAMMAFFLVMWLAAQDSTVRTAIAGYFQQPGALPHQQSNGVVATGAGGVAEGGIPTMVPARPSVLLAAEQQALVAAADQIRKDLGQLGTGALTRQIQLSVTSEGLRIELVEEAQSSFFDSGSSVLKGESQQILAAIAAQVGMLQNNVVIEGHTDSAPFADGRRYDNWNLSADRANSARRAMESSGLRPGQLKAVRGFSDTDLRFKDLPLDPRNRRVSIVVRSMTAQDLETSLRALRDDIAPPNAAAVSTGDSVAAPAAATASAPGR